VHHANHLFAFDFERCTGGNRSGSRHARPNRSGERFFSNKVARAQKGNGGFFASFRNDGEFCAALLKIKDRVSELTLRKEGLTRLHLNDSSSQPGLCEKVSGIESGVL